MSERASEERRAAGVGEAVAAILAILPEHKASLTIEHNAHKATYETVEHYAEFREWDDDDWVSVEERDRAFATQEVWEIQWYPQTPVGFCVMAASTLRALLVHFTPLDSAVPDTESETNGNG